MAAARPSQASIANVIAALSAAGLRPGAIRVNADGSFEFQILQAVEAGVGSLQSANANSPKDINESDAHEKRPRKYGEPKK
jgi:hypothetical protein